MSDTRGPHPLKLLIVSGEDAFLKHVRKDLSNLEMFDRSVELFEARNSGEARTLLQQETALAVVLVDQALETETAGLDLVRHIRLDLGLDHLRLVLRGEPFAGRNNGREPIETHLDGLIAITRSRPASLIPTLQSLLAPSRDEQLEQERRGLYRLITFIGTLQRMQHPQEYFDSVQAYAVQLANAVELPGAVEAIGSAIFTDDGRIPVLQGRQGSLAALDIGSERFATLQANINDLFRNRAHLDPFGPISLFSMQHEDRPVACLALETAGFPDSLQLALLSQFAAAASPSLVKLQQFDNLRHGNRKIMQLLAIAAEYRDEFATEHITSIQRYTEKTALELCLPAEQAEQYGLATITHDIGKLAIPDAILLKPDALTTEEYEIVKQHPQIGAEMLPAGEAFALARQIAHSHHERWDGKGYPDGLAGDTIPLPARILAVVDVFDALVNNRVYKQPWPVEQAIAEIRNGAGTQFDPNVVEAFTRVIEDERIEPARI